MEALDPTSLAARLECEANQYWLHLEAEGPLDKYPGKRPPYAMEPGVWGRMPTNDVQQSSMQQEFKRSSASTLASSTSRGNPHTTMRTAICLRPSDSDATFTILLGPYSSSDEHAVC
jgi:hypothetical protein